MAAGRLFSRGKRHLTQMLYYLTAAGLILHTFFWGAGLAWLAVPRVWARWWWIFAAPLGVALQSAVVWVGAHSSLAGTDAYAWRGEFLPGVLLLAAGIRHHRETRRRFRSLRGAAGVVLLMLLTGWMLLSPMARATSGLTSTSLGSCEPASHAAGARVLQEFSRRDRTGFLDQPETTRVHGVDVFFDYTLRLDHFTPSALIAYNGSVFGLEPYRMVSVTAAAMALLGLPLACFLARAMMGLRGWPLLGVTTLVGLSPLQAYAVHHGALGQLGAVTAIALVTLAGWGAGRAALAGRNIWEWLPLFLAGLWLLAGCYSPLWPWALVPAGLWVALESLWRGNIKAAGRLLVWLAVAVELLAVFSWDRIEGLIRRGGAYSTGWAMPLLMPEGWVGIVRDPDFSKWPAAIQLSLAAVLGFLWLAGLVTLWRVRPAIARVVVCLVLPVVAGWALLAGESRERPLAAFEAWRLIGVFLPGTLAGLCCWLTAARHASPWRQRVAAFLLAGLLVSNLFAADRFRRRMTTPPLRVDRQMVELGRLEMEPQIDSLNLLIRDPWTCLWANAFLLRRAQYFSEHMYEARRSTPMQGQWELSDGQLRALPAGTADQVVLNSRFHAVRVAAPDRIPAVFSTGGWYPPERAGEEIWRWSDDTGGIALLNPRETAQPVRLAVRLRAAQPCTVRIELEGRVVAERTIDETKTEWEIEGIVVPPGRSMLGFRIDRPPISPGDDTRRLAVALFDFTLQSTGAHP